MRGDSCIFMHAHAEGVHRPRTTSQTAAPAGASDDVQSTQQATAVTPITAEASSPKPATFSAAVTSGRARSREPAAARQAPRISVTKSQSTTSSSGAPAATSSSSSSSLNAASIDGKKASLQTNKKTRTARQRSYSLNPQGLAATAETAAAAAAGTTAASSASSSPHGNGPASFSRVCRFWETDTCRKGPECLFIHPGSWTIGATLRPMAKSKQQRLDRALYGPMVEGDLAGVQKWIAEHTLTGLQVIASGESASSSALASDSVVVEKSSSAAQPAAHSTSSDSIRGANHVVQNFQHICDGLYISALLGLTDICRALFETVASSPLLTVACEPRDAYLLQNLLRRVAHLATGEPGTPNHFDASNASNNKPPVIPSQAAIAASNHLRAVGKDIPLTPIDAAAFNGSVPIVSFMLDAGVKERLGAKDSHTAEQFRRAPTTVLERACSRANLDLVRFLLQRVATGPDGAERVYAYINEATPIRRLTALHFAAASSDRRPKVGPQACDVVKLLISYGVDINATDCNDMTPLLMASGKAPLQMIRTLIEAGAIPLPADDGYSPLTAAIRAERVEVVKMLLAANADPNNAAGQGGGWLPLAAVRSDRESSLEILHLLMQYGANVHLIGSVDRPLVGKGCPKAAAVLLGYGAPLGETYQFVYTMNDYLDGPARQTDECDINNLLSELTVELRQRVSTAERKGVFPATDISTLFISSGSLAVALAEKLEAPAAENDSAAEHHLARFLPELRAGRATCCSRCHQWFFGAPACKRRLRARHPGPIGRFVYSVIDLDFCSSDCWKRSYISGSIHLESINGHLQDRMSLAELLSSSDPEYHRIHILYKFKNDLSTDMHELYLAPSQFSLEGFRSELQHGTLQPPPIEAPGETLVVANIDTWHPYSNLSFSVACQEQSELMLGLDWKPHD